MTFKVDSHAFVMQASVAIEFRMRSKLKKKGGLGRTFFYLAKNLLT